MHLEVFTMWVFVGLIAGWVIGVMIKGGSYGLIADMILGLGGSVVGGSIFRSLGAFPEAGMLATVVAAFLGAAAVIVAQRKIWYAHA